jgi:hypothetical protein
LEFKELTVIVLKPDDKKQTLSNFVYKALTTKTHGWGHDTQLGIEGKIERLIESFGRLINVLADKNIVSKGEIELIVQDAIYGELLEGNDIY